MQRRNKDVLKRLERKLNGLDSTAKAFDTITQEINDSRKWIKEKMTALQNPSLLGFELAATEKYLQSLKVNFGQVLISK